MKLLGQRLIRKVAGIILALLAIPAMARGNVTINVATGNSSYRGAAAASGVGTVWNNLPGQSTASYTVANAVDSNGNTLSNVNVTVSTTGAALNAYSSVNYGNPNPVNLMSSYYFGGNFTVSLTGLAEGSYTLLVFAHGNQTNQNSTVTWGSQNGTTGNSGGQFRNLFTPGAQGYSYIQLTGSVGSGSNLAFTATSYLNGFQLVQMAAPVITGLTDQTAYVGNVVVLSPTVAGFPAPTYQWLQNGVVAPGQTNATLSVPPVQLTQSGTQYSLIASNSMGAATNTMTLTVSATPPTLPVLTLNLDVVKSSSTRYTGTAAAPDNGTSWNNFVVPANTNTAVMGNVTDSYGNATTNAISFSRSGANFNVYEDASTADGDPDPVALMEDYLYSGGYTVAVSNLRPGVYTLFAFAHGNATGQGSTVTVNAANGGASGTTTDTGNYRDIFQTNALGNSYLALTGTVGSVGTFSFTTSYLNGFQLQLLSAPIVIGPTNATVVAGTSTTLSPTILGTPAPTYQWFSNSVAISGQTNASLGITNVQYAQNGTLYALGATNPAGSVTSGMTLTVIVTPAITGLNNQTVTPGSTVTVAPTVSGVPAPTCLWQYNGSNLSDGLDANGSTISGSATSTLTLTNAQIADSGVYFLILSNRAGLVTNSMTLTVSSGTVAPAILGLTNQTAVQTSNLTFIAAVTGLPTPALQWLVNGTDIVGATNSSLTISNVQYSQNGWVYGLVASNSVGMASNTATLYVLVPPAISQQPTNLTVIVGGSARFSVVASGVPALAYQWYQNGHPIASATNAAYSIASAQGAINGAVFSVAVGNGVGTVTSSNATLTVLTAATEAFLPTNGAVNISPDQQLRIVFGNPPQLGSGNLYVYNAADHSLLATISTSQFQTFNLWADTITNAAVRVEQGNSFYYMPIAIYGNQVWITLTNRFAYNSVYYVNSDAGLFLDASNNAYPAITGTNTWQFATKPAGPATPTASTGPTNLTVALDGAGDFATLQGASDWIPINNAVTRTITLLPGTYRDFSIFTQNRNNVNLFGAGPNCRAVQIIYPYAAYAGTSNSGCGTLRLESSNIYVRNLTLDNQVYLTNNGVVWAGPINVLATTGNELTFDNVLIKGGQDTIYNISGVVYYNHCEIWGSTDFIYGGALAVFDQCNIVEICATGGYCTAPSTPYAQPYGLTFLNCSFPLAQITNGYPYNCAANSTTLMRPWQQDGMTAVIDCTLDSQITTEGWSPWGGRENSCRARETGTMLVGGGTVTAAQRQAAGAYWLDTINTNYENNPSLSYTNPLVSGNSNRVAVTVDSNSYTLPAIFTNSYFGLNGWLPTVIPTIATQPVNQAVNLGTTVTFAVAATGQPGPTFQWLKNGDILNGQINPTLTVTNAQFGDAAAYSVIVSNSAGSVTSSNALLSVALSAPSPPAIPNGTNNVAAFGAVGDGVTTNTAAIQAAINATSLAGGGTVEIPAGTYLSGPLYLSNSINLQIDAGAMLQMLPYGSFPASSDFIAGVNLHDIEVSGSGTIDGQGSVWWATNNATPGGITRPKAMLAATTCTNVRVVNVTLQNPPNTHISFRDVCQNVTVDGISINTPSPSPNTDGIDCSAAKALIENSRITDGDDHIAMGDGNVGHLCHDITVENCLFGNGHGVSIGSYTDGGLSNLLVLNCVWTNGGAGIKVKSDIDRGGVVQNLRYLNLAMTNTQIPIYFYGYYTNGGTATGVAFSQAASYPIFPVTGTTPIYENIVVSNLTAWPAGGYSAGIIWGRPELCISNVVLDHVNITASQYFEVYNARGVQVIDSQIAPAAGSTLGLFDAAVTITNRTPATNLVLVDGITTNGFGNSLACYGAPGALSDTNVLGNGPLTLSDSVLTISNNLALTPSTVFNYVLGASAATVAVKGNLALGGTVNVSGGGGFTNGTYTLLTYTGTLGGNLPALGAFPASFICALSTNTSRQVNLLVTSAPLAPASLTAQGTNLLINLQWTSSGGALGYELERSLTNGGPYALLTGVAATNYADAAVRPGTTYYYVVAATNAAGVSPVSVQANATPLPSLLAANVSYLNIGGQIQLSWPADHLGWRLQIQTNSAASGLGTNWVTVANSTNVNQASVPVDPNNGSVYLRLIYP